MNVGMPYRPFRSQSRVEFIKQKFEGSLSENNEPSQLKRTNTTVPCPSNSLQDVKNSNAEKKSIDFKTGSDFKSGFGSKTDGKAVVKRSPAFRREKLGCAKSLTQTSLQEPVTLKKLEYKTNKDAHEEILKSVDVVGVNTWNNFKRSKTDTNLLKYCSSKSKDKEFLWNNSKNNEIPNPLLNSQNKHADCKADKTESPQYSVVNKKESFPNRNEVVGIKFSESIRRALQSPLPKGPPPKKPPRTFCHIPVTQAHCHINNTQKLTISTNNDIPKLKSKLEKLEKIIQIHGTGNQDDKKKVESEKQLNNVREVADQAVDEVGSSQTCLPISHSLNQGTKPQSISKLSKAKSEFYLELNKTDFKPLECFGKNKDCSFGSTYDEIPVRKSTVETIYDLPCITKKNSFKTFGKCTKDVKESVNSIKAESLHYMCTDVISQVSKYPNYKPEVMESEREAGISVSKSNSSTNIQKQKSSSMSRIDNVKEPVNNLKVGKGSEKKKKLMEVKELLCSSVSEKRNGEPSLELPLLNSDCTEVRNINEADESLSTARRKVYVSRVSSKLANQVPLWKNKNRNSYKHLFECCLLVGLTLCESKQNVPYIKNIFPPDTKPPPLIESLCFPDASYWPPTSETHHEEQYYTLVVTNENGERKFGYCRRVLPEGGHVCLPLAYCIITPHRAGGFFYKVLEELESRHGSPGLDNLIKQLYESEFPGPGERLKLKEILEEVTRTSRLDSEICLSSTLVRRPPDLRLEEKDLTQLFQHLHLSVFLKVFSSLLHERKVLLLSTSLRNLSSCTEALQSILLPFSWQHTYIPVLPVHLIEMCEAPTPYVIGLLKPRNVEKSLANINFEDGILVDLDDSKILRCCGDEGSILPSRFIRDLRTALNLAMTATDLLSESVRSVLISDAFIRFFVQVCGNYSKFIQNLPNGERFFQKDEFIKSSASNTTQSFLEWFTETAMFSSFIQERLQGDDEDVPVKLFTRRAMEYSDDIFKDSALLLKNYRVMNKKGGANERSCHFLLADKIPEVSTTLEEQPALEHIQVTFTCK